MCIRDCYGPEPLAEDAVADHLDGLALGAADAVLVKGSRIVGLEALAGHLLEG